MNQAVDDLRKEAVKTGTSKLTAKQISAEVEAYRREKQKKKLK